MSTKELGCQPVGLLKRWAFKMLKISTVWGCPIPEVSMHVQCRNKDLPPTILCLEGIHRVVIPLASLVNAWRQIRAQPRPNLCHMPWVDVDKSRLRSCWSSHITNTSAVEGQQACTLSQGLLVPPPFDKSPRMRHGGQEETRASKFLFYKPLSTLFKTQTGHGQGLKL